MLRGHELANRRVHSGGWRLSRLHRTLKWLAPELVRCLAAEGTIGWGVKSSGSRADRPREQSLRGACAEGKGRPASRAPIMSVLYKSPP